MSAYLSLIGLMIFGNASVLYTIGWLCIGFVARGSVFRFWSQSSWVNNIITYAILVLNLILIHVVAWNEALRH